MEGRFVNHEYQWLSRKVLLDPCGRRLQRVLLEHRHLYAVCLGDFSRRCIPGVSMSHDPYPRISSQYPFELSRSIRRPIGNQTHPGVNTIPHSHAAPLMHADPSRAGGSVQKRVEDRPVSNGITTVEHALSLYTRRRDASAI